MVYKKVKKSEEVKEVTPLTKEERVTKRREKVIKIINDFTGESSKIISETRSISAEIKVNDSRLKKIIREREYEVKARNLAIKELDKETSNLETVNQQLARRDMQIKAFENIIENYSEMVCEKFNVKKENVDTIMKTGSDE